MDQVGQASDIAPEFVGGKGDSASSSSATEIALTRTGALRLDSIDLLRGPVIAMRCGLPCCCCSIPSA